MLVKLLSANADRAVGAASRITSHLVKTRCRRRGHAIPWPVLSSALVDIDLFGRDVGGHELSNFRT